MGEGFVPIVKSKMRQLISAQPQTIQNYLSKAKRLLKEYKFEQKL